VNPADGKYVIGSPLVEEATIQLDSKFYPGGKFTVLAHDASNQNIYVQSAKLNGEPINRPWINSRGNCQGGDFGIGNGNFAEQNWGTATIDFSISCILIIFNRLI